MYAEMHTTSHLPGNISTNRSISHPIDLLILGAGWTSTFLVSLLDSKNLSHIATTRTGRDDTLTFFFDPDSEDLTPYATLPLAKNILITFPLKGADQPKTLVERYCRAHGLAVPISSNDSSISTSSMKVQTGCSSQPLSSSIQPTGNKEQQITQHQPHWIQFGTTSIFNHQGWNTATDPGPDLSNPRAEAEEALLSLSYTSSSSTSTPTTPIATVLNLCGLYGPTRIPRNWISRVASSRTAAKAKSSLHLIHGDDVARAVVATMEKWESVKGRRWIVSDCHVWDWWDVIWEIGGQGRHDDGNEGESQGPEWANGKSWREVIAEFMDEEGVRALPRPPEALGRCLDGRDFWGAVGLWPRYGREWAVL